MENIKIIVPEGYEAIKNDNNEIIVRKKGSVQGYYIDNYGLINYDIREQCFNHNLFATEIQARSARAMAILSQKMKNQYFGNPFTKDEWRDRNVIKYVILRAENKLIIFNARLSYEFLAFRSMEQAESFLKENKELIKEFYML